MRFLVDENSGPVVARWLRQQGHEVFSVYEQARGLPDDAILQKAFQEEWILITCDKDFGEMIFRERHPHRGVIFLRLDDERNTAKVETLRRLLGSHAQHLADHFVVATADRVRWAGPPRG